MAEQPTSSARKETVRKSPDRGDRSARLVPFLTAGMAFPPPPDYGPGSGSTPAPAYPSPSGTTSTPSYSSPAIPAPAPAPVSVGKRGLFHASTPEAAAIKAVLLAGLLIFVGVMVIVLATPTSGPPAAPIPPKEPPGKPIPPNPYEYNCSGTPCNDPAYVAARDEYLRQADSYYKSNAYKDYLRQEHDYSCSGAPRYNEDVSVWRAEYQNAVRNSALMVVVGKVLLAVGCLLAVFLLCRIALGSKGEVGASTKAMLLGVSAVFLVAMVLGVSFLTPGVAQMPPYLSGLPSSCP